MSALITLGLLGVVLSLTAPRAGDMDAVSNFVAQCAPIFILAVGGLLALRRPDSWAGWTLLALGASAAVDALSKSVLQHAIVHASWAQPLASWSAWLDNWLWTTQLSGVLFIVLKFSGGTDYGRRMRFVGWGGIGMLSPILLLAVLAPKNETYPQFPTPLHVGLPYKAINSVGTFWFIGATVCFACGVGALISHARHSDGAERARLRWLMWSFGTGIGFSLVGNLLSIAVDGLHLYVPDVAVALNVLSQLGFLTIPLAIYVSITRYGLFEIDRVVSRTVSYTALILLLTAVYVAIVTSATRLIPHRFGSFAVAAATLTVAAVFVPVRRRLVAAIDRRFNRGRYDAEQVVGAFAERVRHDGANDPRGADLLAAVHEVFQPVTANVWLVQP